MTRPYQNGELDPNEWGLGHFLICSTGYSLMNTHLDQ